MRPGIVVGVHAHTEPARLLDTVRSIGRSARQPVPVVLLADGPDPTLEAALATEATLAALPRWGTAEPAGAPACFNRLAAGTDEAVLVFLESGTVLAPGCLDLLTDALAQDGRGLAGPSTNRSWNEQGVFPDGHGGQRDPDGSGGPPTLRRRRPLPRAPAQPGRLLFGRHPPDHRGRRRRRRGLRTRTLLGDGLQRARRPGGRARGVGGGAYAYRHRPLGPPPAQ